MVTRNKKYTDSDWCMGLLFTLDVHIVSETHMHIHIAFLYTHMTSVVDIRLMENKMLLIPWSCKKKPQRVKVDIYEQKL